MSVIQFYDLIIGDHRNYSRWIKQYLTEHPAAPILNQDYFEVSKKQVGPKRQRRDYLITLDLLKQICFDLKTIKSRDVRAWAIQYTNRRCERDRAA